jgi:hypothetical protein
MVYKEKTSFHFITYFSIFHQPCQEKGQRGKGARYKNDGAGQLGKDRTQDSQVRTNWTG